MSIHIDPLEKKWIILTSAIVLFMWAIIIYYAAEDDVHPPSNVEVIDSAQLHLPTGKGGGEFMEKNLGVHKDAKGNIVVTMIAARYGFYPQHITIPAHTRIKFRMASFDVLHGALVPFSNMNVMLVPGYVSQVFTQFNKVGKFPIICNEYCGLGHAYMYGMLNIVPKNQFKLKAGGQ